ncbi:MAG: nucleoside monophosphate kinase [bacterium]|nr:nucleoside monophosphate kinase [bacterium]
MARKRLRGFIFGPQGAGKSTQGHLLSDRYGIPFLSAGDLFRVEIDEKTHLGKLVEQYVSSGLLAPDELTNAIILQRLQKFDLEKGFLLDGYPRNVDQAESLDRLIKINLAIQVKLSDEEAVRRLSGRLQCVHCHSVFHISEVPPAMKEQCSVCGTKLVRRKDDDEVTIRHRLATYHFMTEPIAAYYRERGVLLAVNAAQSIPLLFEELVRKMAKLGFVA